MPPVGSPAQPVTLYDVAGNPLLWSGAPGARVEESRTFWQLQS